METEGARVRIDELRLSGFRAFENGRLALDDLTVLVGRNGAGKSTLLDALEFLREALTDGLESALERRGGFLALAHKSPRASKGIAVATKLTVSPEFIREVARASGLHNEVISRDLPAQFTYGFRLGLRRGGMGVLVENEVARFDFGDISGAYRDAQEEEENEPPWARDVLALPHWALSHLPFRVTLEALRESLRAYRLSPAAIRAEPPIGPASILARDGGNVGDVLKHVEKHKEDLAWVVEHLGAITPGIVGIKSGTAAGRRLVQFFQSAGGKSKTRFDIGDMSDGTLRCLAILLALRQRPAPAIVAIDEIEDSVHPAALAVLLDAVAASADRCQVLLTSHSPEALSHPAVTAGRVRVVEWREGRSEIFRLSPGAEEMSRPPRSVGKLLRTNALFTAEEPERVVGDFFEGP